MKCNSKMLRTLSVPPAVLAVALLASCGQAGAPQPQAMSQGAPATTAAVPPGAGAASQPVAAEPDVATGQPEAAPPLDRAVANAPRFAQVVAVQPITESVTHSKPRRVCRDEQVAVPETYKDKHQVGCAVVGGVIGAIAGHQIGGGKGKQLATVGGAAAGALAGHEIQKNHQEKNRTHVETRNVCRTVTDKTTSDKTVDYDVTYRLNGRIGHVRMDHNPGVGSGLPVRDGKVAVGERPAGSYYR